MKQGSCVPPLQVLLWAVPAWSSCVDALRPTWMRTCQMHNEGSLRGPVCILVQDARPGAPGGGCSTPALRLKSSGTPCPWLGLATCPVPGVAAHPWVLLWQETQPASHPAAGQPLTGGSPRLQDGGDGLVGAAGQVTGSSPGP